METLLLESQSTLIIYYAPSNRAESCIRYGFTSHDVSILKNYLAGAKPSGYITGAVQFMFDSEKLAKLIELHENYIADTAIDVAYVTADLSSAISYINVIPYLKNDELNDKDIADLYPKIHSALKERLKQIKSAEEEGIITSKDGITTPYKEDDGTFIPNIVTRIPQKILASADKVAASLAGTLATTKAYSAQTGTFRDEAKFSGQEMPASNLKLSPSGLQFIKTQEGFRNYAYPDAGKYAIGYGTQVKPQDYPNGVTREQGERMLQTKINQIENLLRKTIKVNLNQNQWDALVSFIYNVGTNNFKNSTLLKKLNSGDKVGAANQFLVWTHAQGRHLPRLAERRKKEMDVFIA